MSNYAGVQGKGLAELVGQIKSASRDIRDADTRMSQRIDTIEATLNNELKRRGRPGGFTSDGEPSERKAAITTCRSARELKNPKADLSSYEPSHAEIDSAVEYRKVFPTLLRQGHLNNIQTKSYSSLSSFSFGSNQWLMPAEVSSRVIDCLIDGDDLSGLVGNVAMSGNELIFPIDATDWNGGPQWDCSECSIPAPTAETNFGTVSVVPNSLKFTVCLTRSLIDDASMDVEAWVINNASRAFRNAINFAIVRGSGVGMPVGIMSENSGIPVVTPSPSTPAGQISWADLLAMRYELPPKFMRNAVFVMNQRTLAQIMTTQSATGSPLMVPQPIMGAPTPDLSLFGARVIINNWMPDVGPGACCVLYADLQELYVLATRQAIQVFPDFQSNPFCPKLYFWSRIGSAILCPNSGRLLRT